MASETTYKCDVCGNRLDPDADKSRPQYGYALRWTAADALDVTGNWRDAPRHFCVKCIRALGHFRDQALTKDGTPK